MPKPLQIDLPTGETIPILYEDRSVLAIDKPAGWLLVPNSWTRTRRNLQLQLETDIKAGEFWAKSRSLKYLRYIHRLDSETSGVLLMAKSPGALATMSKMFEERTVDKTYIAVLAGNPKRDQWTCTMKLSNELNENGRIELDHVNGREAETDFIVLARAETTALVKAVPHTGRTHQIRVHAAATNHPVIADPLYFTGAPTDAPMALRSIAVGYDDPFDRRRVYITANPKTFLNAHGFRSVVASSIFSERRTV